MNYTPHSSLERETKREKVKKESGKQKHRSRSVSLSRSLFVPLTGVIAPQLLTEIQQIMDFMENYSESE